MSLANEELRAAFRQHCNSHCDRPPRNHARKNSGRGKTVAISTVALGLIVLLVAIIALSDRFVHDRNMESTAQDSSGVLPEEMLDIQREMLKLFNTPEFDKLDYIVQGSSDPIEELRALFREKMETPEFQERIGKLTDHQSTEAFRKWALERLKLSQKKSRQ